MTINSHYSINHRRTSYIENYEDEKKFHLLFIADTLTTEKTSLQNKRLAYSIPFEYCKITLKNIQHNNNTSSSLFNNITLATSIISIIRTPRWSSFEHHQATYATRDIPASFEYNRRHTAHSKDIRRSIPSLFRDSPPNILKNLSEHELIERSTLQREPTDVRMLSHCSSFYTHVSNTRVEVADVCVENRIT